MEMGNYMDIDDYEDYRLPTYAECSHLVNLISLALMRITALQKLNSEYPHEIQHHLTVTYELLRHEIFLSELEYQGYTYKNDISDTLYAFDPNAEEINADKWLLYGLRKATKMEEEA